MSNQIDGGIIKILDPQTIGLILRIIPKRDIIQALVCRKFYEYLVCSANSLVVTKIVSSTKIMIDAINTEDYKIIKFLLNNSGIDPNCVFKTQLPLSMWHRSFISDQPFSVTGINMTGLMIACMRKNLKLVSLFINHCSVDSVSSNTTALMLSLICNFPEGVELLVKNDCYIGQISTLKHQFDRWNYNPILVACIIGRLECLKFLITNNSSLYTRLPQTGYIPLHLAIKYGHTEIIEYLLEKKTNPDYTDYSGKCPLKIAIDFNNLKAIQLLIKYKAYIDHTNNGINRVEHTLVDGLYTPLVNAVNQNKSDACKLLIEAGAFVNEADLNHDSILLTAISIRNIDICKLLIKAGCDINGKSNTQTPLIYAIKNNFYEGFKLLLISGADINVKNNEKVTVIDVLKGDKFEDKYFDILVKYL
tara:strand:+ start:1246 stop:2502 length:1257 start_codon:yes stop_codon:yes gene_type:complete